MSSQKSDKLKYNAAQIAETLKVDDFLIEKALKELQSLNDYYQIPKKEQKDENFLAVVKVIPKDDNWHVFIKNDHESHVVTVTKAQIDDSGLTPQVIAANLFETLNPGYYVSIPPHVTQQYFAFGTVANNPPNWNWSPLAGTTIQDIPAGVILGNAKPFSTAAVETHGAFIISDPKDVIKL